MAADDRVDPRHRLGDLDVGVHPEVRHQDDLVDAVGLERLHLAGEIGDRIAEDVGLVRRGDLGGVGRGRAEDRHLLAADVEHQPVLGERREALVGGDIDAAGEHREGRGLDELRQGLGAEVELVVAVDHRVEADPVHHLGLDLAGIGGEEQRALEDVAGLEHQHVAAGALDLRRGARSIAVTSRAAPPKHLPAASSSAEQVESKALIDSIRLWKSLKCRMSRVKACAPPAESAKRAAARTGWRAMGGASWGCGGHGGAGSEGHTTRG